MPKLIVSFGFRHGSAPNYPGCRTIDVRPWFGRNPYHNRKLRSLRGDHPDVIADIEKTPDFAVNFEKLKATVAAEPNMVFLGCTGGHHRSVYLANRIGLELGVPVKHLHYNDK